MATREELKEEFCRAVDQLGAVKHTGKVVVSFQVSEGGVLDAYIDVGRKLLIGGEKNVRVDKKRE